MAPVHSDGTLAGPRTEGDSVPRDATEEMGRHEISQAQIMATAHPTYMWDLKKPNSEKQRGWGFPGACVGERVKYWGNNGQNIRKF